MGRINGGQIMWLIFLYVASLLASAPTSAFGLFLLVGIVWAIVAGCRYLERHSERSVVRGHALRHLRQLSSKHAALESRNGYGAVHPKEWAREVNRFLDTVGLNLKRLTREDAHALVTGLVEYDRKHGTSAQVEASWSGGLSSPEAFERMCAARLEALGWRTTLTRKSGDQGIDVLARRGDEVAVVQCKLYSQPVDNSAVQQALAGMLYAGANLAAVVSNAGFTRSAHDLAGKTGARLLHYSDLDQLGAPTHPSARSALPAAQPLQLAAASLGDPERGVLGNYSGRTKARLRAGRGL